MAGYDRRVLPKNMRAGPSRRHTIMNLTRVTLKALGIPLLSAATIVLSPAASAWDCPPGPPYYSEAWNWCHEEVIDPVYAKVALVGVAENQSTSWGTPAIAYVAKPATATFPYTFEIKVRLGSTVETVQQYTSTPTNIYNILEVPSISVLPSGDVYVAWAESRLSNPNQNVKILSKHRDPVTNTWSSATTIFTTYMNQFRHDLGQFDVQIYDDTHFAWGGSWWTQASPTADFYFYYRLKMREGASGQKDIIVNGSNHYNDGEDYWPSLYGPVFRYKMGTSASSPSSVVFNEADYYNPGSGNPLGEKLKVFRLDPTTYAKVTDAVICNSLTPYFALATTSAGKRHVVYQEIAIPSGTKTLKCATSSAVGSWATHQPSLTGDVFPLGEPIAASADPSSTSDAFDVFCWTPDYGEPITNWVLHHSSGTSYSTDVVVADSFGGTESKSIGTSATGENLVHVYMSNHQLAVN